MIRTFLLTVLFLGFGAGSAFALPSGAGNVLPFIEVNSFDKLYELGKGL